MPPPGKTNSVFTKLRETPIDNTLLQMQQQALLVSVSGLMFWYEKYAQKAVAVFYDSRAASAVL